MHLSTIAANDNARPQTAGIGRWSVAAALGMTVVVFGLLLGYRSPLQFAIFTMSTAMVSATAWRIAAADDGGRDPAGSIVRTATAAFAVIVLCGLVLGSVGWLTPAAYLIAEAIACAAVFAWVRGPGPSSRPPCVAGSETASRAPAAVIPALAIVGALLVFALAYGITHAPLTLYDSVSYHLYFSARWLQDRRLSILPTPFSDEAQAYAPANGELFFLWLMMPFHGDLLARIGEFPFALFAAFTLYALARRLGAQPGHAVYPAAFYLLARPVVEQAVGSDVDVICAAMFLAAIYLTIGALDRDRRRDWAWAGAAAGLYAGTKYVALVYMPVLLLVALSRGVRRRILWAAPGVALLGLPWYLRNWIAAGSPIYPATLKLAGVTIARGAFTRQAMLNTIFHTNDLGLLPSIASHAIGPTLAIIWIPIAAVGFAALVRRGWWPAGVLLLVPAVMIPLYWFAFPVNIDSRFLMPAVAPALLPFAFAFRRSRAWNAIAHVVFAAALAWIVVGVHASIPVRGLPWFMDGWNALDGLVQPAFLAAFAGLAFVIGVVWWALARAGRQPGMAVTWLLAVATCGLAVGGEYWCRPARCDYLDTTSPFIRMNYVAAWDWIAANVHDATIAYTGINLPYPLSGRHLANRVVYVNIDAHPRWRFHDYDRALRSGRLEAPSTPLATSSGELLPVPPGAIPRDDAVRPRYERMAGSKEAWIGNLQVLGVTHVFVAALSAYEVRDVAHNAGNFPIEDDWAASDRELFRLVYENPMVHVYELNVVMRRRA